MGLLFNSLAHRPGGMATLEGGQSSHYPKESGGESDKRHADSR